MKRALVLSSGGITGAAFQVGVLRALDRFFKPGFTTCDFDVYVGVSAGSIIATLVSQGVTPEQLFAAGAGNQPSPFNPPASDFYRIQPWRAVRALWRVVTDVVKMVFEHAVARRKLSAIDILYRVQERLASGLFPADPMADFVARLLKESGLSNSFAELKNELFIPSIDLDRGAVRVFGGAAEPHAINQAVAASCSIPGFFRPYKIGAHWFVDGAVGSPVHLDVASAAGARLIVLVNPVVPMDESAFLPSLATGEATGISDLGLAMAMDQAKRINRQRALELAIRLHRLEHPEVDLLVIEPARSDALLFLQNPMSAASRLQIMRNAYTSTLAHLSMHLAEYEAILTGHGIDVDHDFLKR